MSNRYLIVIPPHKEPYIKSFNNKEKAVSIVAAKTGREPLVKTSCDLFDREIVFFLSAVKRKSTIPSMPLPGRWRLLVPKKKFTAMPLSRVFPVMNTADSLLKRQRKCSEK